MSSRKTILRVIRMSIGADCNDLLRSWAQVVRIRSPSQALYMGTPIAEGECLNR